MTPPDAEADANGGNPAVPICHSTYEGGLSTAEYALFVERGNAFMDVVPVGDHAWFSFRQHTRAGGKNAAGDAEALDKALNKAARNEG